MKSHQHIIGVVLLVCPLLLQPACTQPVSVTNDRMADLVQAASRSDRQAWWPAAQQLGVLSSRDPVLRDAIWQSARVNTLGMKFVRVEAGTFTMGPDTHRIFDIQVAHQVRIARPFYVGVTEVTNEQFRSVFPEHRADAAFSPDADSPAVRVKWKQAVEFCRILSEREGATYRLPTEAEWEYACRAGTNTWYNFGASTSGMPAHGWCLGDYTRAAPVAQLQPNAWGIYDMHGNVFEWVSDFFSHKYYAECLRQGTVKDPKGPDFGRTHVLRSSGWQVHNVYACTCMARFPLPILDRKPFTPDTVGMRAMIGFRVVRELGQDEAP